LKGCIEREVKAEHMVEDTPFIEIEKLVAAAEQIVIKQDDRDNLALASVPHFCCHEQVISDIILGKIYPFDLQELLGAPAVNTILPGIDFYFDFHCNRSGIDFH
jgi:hypothetical protein